MARRESPTRRSAPPSQDAGLLERVAGTSARDQQGIFTAGHLAAAQRYSLAGEIGRLQGNRQLQRTLEVHNDAAAGAQRQPAPTVGAKEKPEVRSDMAWIGVTEFQVPPEGPVEPQVRDIDAIKQLLAGQHDPYAPYAGTPYTPEKPVSIDQFLAETRVDVGRWAGFRESFAGEKPGNNHAIHDKIRQQASDIYWEMEGHPGVYSAEDKEQLRSYLAQSLAPEGLYLLREMLAIDWLTSGTDEMAYLFRLRVPMPLFHHYTLEVMLQNAELPGSVGISPKVMSGLAIIRYRNDLGMRYEKPLNLTLAGIRAGVGGGPGLEAGSIQSAEVISPVFWAPDDFKGMVEYRKFGAGGRMGVSPVEPKAELTLVEQLTFYEGDLDITFDLGTGLQVNSFELDPDWKGQKPEAEAGLEEIIGYASSAGETTSAVPVVPPRERRETGTVHRFAVASVFFETGHAVVEGDANKTIGETVEAVERFRARHPDYRLLVLITGHASPRWRHHGHSVTSQELNLALSRERADNTMAQIRNAIVGLWGGECDFRVETCAEPEMTVDDPTWDRIVTGIGAKRAMDLRESPDENSWFYRRADVELYYNEVGYVTEEAPPVPTPR